MTQQELADLVGVGQSVISTMEGRDNRKSDHAGKLAEVLGVSLDWLMTGEDASADGAVVVKHGAGSRKLADEHYLLIALFNNISQINQEMVIRFMQDNQLISRPEITEQLKGSVRSDTNN